MYFFLLCVPILGAMEAPPQKPITINFIHETLSRPKDFRQAPPAQPLHKVIKALGDQKRLELLPIINARYYAQHEWPAITLLAKVGYFESLKILLDNDQSIINDQDLLGYSPLARAAKHGKFTIAKLLIEYGADLKLKNKCHKTAADLARENSHQEILALIQGKQEELENKNTLQPPRTDS